MKKCVDICNELKAPILGGVNYAGWGYLTKKPRTTEEWNWGVENMRQVARYAKETGEVTICVECVNRFETHFPQHCRGCSTVLQRCGNRKHEGSP